MPNKEKLYHDLLYWCKEVSQKAKAFSEDAKDHALIKMILDKIGTLASAVAQTSEHMITVIQEAKSNAKRDSLSSSTEEKHRRCVDCKFFSLYGSICNYNSSMKIENPYLNTTCKYFYDACRNTRKGTTND